MSAPVLRITGLSKRFALGGGRFVNAVNAVDLTIAPGETLGVVGESGSGKSTLGRTLLRLTDPSEGRIEIAGQDITDMPMGRIRPLRRDMQMVFQDPWSALNPRMTIGNLIAEPMRVHLGLSGAELRRRTEELSRRVHLGPAYLDRTPASLSGGQLQRVCIARAIATNPRLIVLDEPTSSLDLSVRAGILELLAEIRAETQAAMMFISHDLGTVRLISDRIAVLYLGRVVEEGPTAQLFDSPAHPYTQALLSARLPADPTITVRRHVLEGEIPSPIAVPSGCAFHTRCPVAIDACRRHTPEAVATGPGRSARCLRIADGGNIIPSMGAQP